MAKAIETPKVTWNVAAMRRRVADREATKAAPSTVEPLRESAVAARWWLAAVPTSILAAALRLLADKHPCDAVHAKSRVPGAAAALYRFHGSLAWLLCAVLGVAAAVGMRIGVMDSKALAARAGA